MPRFALMPVVAALALLGASVGAPDARAHVSTYRLHVEGHLPFGGWPVAVDVPWDGNRGECPLDFTDGVVGEASLDRLGRAWSALQRLPAGEYVTIETDDEDIRAWREAGYLVLEPRRLDRPDGPRSRVSLPDPIVEAMLAHDGRLTGRDIERLASGRDRLPIVKVKSGASDLFVWVGRDTGGDAR